MKRLLVAATLALAFAAPIAAGADEPATVNDVTQINPIVVERVVRPKSVEEVAELVKGHSGPISIGGARHSMGGQIATENALFLDMRDLDKVLELSVEARTIRVQAGITWRKIQEAIDPHDLAVKVMQSYANFTVGGSLSVNAHGRYVGQGSLVGSVRSIKVVLADGSVVTASRDENHDLFRGVIGGYGSLGVIVEATLDLVANQKVERSAKRMPIRDYKKYFFDEIRDAKTAVFHNADIYPPAYDTVMAITWSETDHPLTVLERLPPFGASHWKERFAYWWMSEAPFGKESRRTVLDPLRLRGTAVVWRNHEASYDAGELEPVSRTRSTYVLEEYFIPVERFDEFTEKMRAVLKRHDANIVNISIRHASKDDESLMAWAREECFAFVVYYKQGVRPDDREEVGKWTRELIDAALSSGGTYYLPYQLHATDDQFRRGYPRANDLFAMKLRLDPTYKFRNKLWDRYYHPEALKALVETSTPSPTPEPTPAAASTEAPKTSTDTAPAASAAPENAAAELADAHDALVRETLRIRKGYARDASQTYLTLPEWYIVYSADEFAASVEDHRPSDFPYLRSVAQFWRIYSHVLRATWGKSEWGYQLMIAVIGPSYSFEYLAKGLYENVLGRLSELTMPGGAWQPQTPEDVYLAGVWRDYASFIHATPWFAYPFAEKIGGVWSTHGSVDRTLLRRLERRVSATFGYGFKTAWGWIIRKSNESAYDPEEQTIQVWARKAPGVTDAAIVAREDLDERSELLKLPRYEPFTRALSSLAEKGVHFVEIAGNDRILVTLIAPEAWHDSQNRGALLVEWPILTRPAMKRVAMTLDVARLDEVLPSFGAEQVAIDHVYDF